MTHFATGRVSRNPRVSDAFGGGGRFCGLWIGYRIGVTTRYIDWSFLE